ncbi:TAP-like protein-domain-containing protein [Stachybotrys elegans]|uniref:TAP-like protein-domain-containing protein n=1 Tax=Stachybotrys elegans TaxID=80388 RepID=A0A8K0SDG3_9HYPO|nr:TAP-like protein-domain-containing protein [Stachybotrys elegans]
MAVNFRGPSSRAGKSDKSTSSATVARKERREPSSNSTIAIGMLLAVALGLAILHRFQGPALPKEAAPRQAQAPQEDVFGEIPVKTELDWQPCFRGDKQARFQCARLAVPVVDGLSKSTAKMADNRNSNKPRTSFSDQTIELALIMLPGKGHVDRNNFSDSPLIVSPGATGVGGVDFVRLAGQYLQHVTGSDQDIVGFDPRGSGYSRPHIDCWTSLNFPVGPEDSKSKLYTQDAMRVGYEHRSTWATQKAALELPDLEQDGRRTRVADAHDRAVTSLCRDKHEKVDGQSSLFPYMGTRYTASDMMRIVDAWELWKFGPRSSTEVEKDQTSENRNPASTKGKLVFWGFSYGSFVGTTFAAMYPDRVGRLILDGVVDAYENSRPFRKSSLRDTDKVLDQFFYECQEARDRCAFYRQGDRVSDIMERYSMALENLVASPIYYIDPDSREPRVFGLSGFKKRVFAALQLPLSSFGDLAVLLNSVYARDTLRLATVLRGTSPISEGNKLSGLSRRLANDAALVTQCADKLQPMDQTIPQIQAALTDMLGSSQFGDVWMALNMQCNGWSISSPGLPTEKLPFWARNEPAKTKRLAAVSPLLIGNSFDPVTPLEDAVAMAREFEKAAVVELRTAGHTSLAARSGCLGEAVRDYLQSGAVSASVKGARDFRDDNKGVLRMRCDADGRPFGNGAPMKQPQQVGGKETSTTWEGMAQKIGRDIFMS